MKLDLGRLAQLLDELVTDVRIRPILEMRTIIGGVLNPGPANVVAAWEIEFTAPDGTFTYRGESVGDAVEAAYSDQSSWR